MNLQKLFAARGGDPAVIVQRAYALITKSGFEQSEGGVIVRGTATTPSPDRYGDEVMPLGAEYKLPLSFLWQHMSAKPVGNVRAASLSADGIDFEAFMPEPSKSAALIERYQEARESVELGLVRGVSIGFRALPNGFEVIDHERFSLRFTKWEWLELSLVTIPANAEATIDNVKHYASAGLPATAHRVTRLTAEDMRRTRTKNQATYLK